MFSSSCCKPISRLCWWWYCRGFHFGSTEELFLQEFPWVSLLMWNVNMGARLRKVNKKGWWVKKRVSWFSSRGSLGSEQQVTVFVFTAQGQIIIGLFPWEPRQEVGRLCQLTKSWMIVKREVKLWSINSLTLKTYLFSLSGKTSLPCPTPFYFAWRTHCRRKKLQTNSHYTFDILINYFLGEAEAWIWKYKY